MCILDLKLSVTESEWTYVLQANTQNCSHHNSKLDSLDMHALVCGYLI